MKVLITAYDVNPYKGSESGTGWNFSYELSRYCHVILVTRKNNKEQIDRYIKENNIEDNHLELLYYDLPFLLRFYKRKEFGSFLYYNTWLIGVIFFVWKNKLEFDVSQHLNFHADHVPYFLWCFGKPSVWGPINHNERIPTYHLNTIEIFKDRLKFFFKYIRWNFDPFIYLSKKKSSLIIGGTPQVKTRLKIPEGKFKFLSTIGSDVSTYIPEVKSKFILVSAGRLVKIKGFDLILRSFKKFTEKLETNYEERPILIIVGDGPEKKKLREMIYNLDIDSNDVIFTGWLQKSEINDIYKTSTCYISSSFEGGGAVVAEAMSFSLPIICFDGFGASSIVDESCSIKVHTRSTEEDIQGFASAMHRLYSDKSLVQQLSDGSRRKFMKDLSWEAKGKVLFNLLTSIK